MDLLEIKINKDDDFLKIAETLTRIGFKTKDRRLVQTCHILHKRGCYYICHFKELFQLDGVKKSDLTDADIERRNGIADLLQQWNLCEIVDKSQASKRSLEKVSIIPFRQKNDYVLKSNYTIGKK